MTRGRHHRTIRLIEPDVMMQMRDDGESVKEIATVAGIYWRTVRDLISAHRRLLRSGPMTKDERVWAVRAASWPMK